MVVYAVETVRKEDGYILPYTSVTAILYATRESAESFIAGLEASYDWKFRLGEGYMHIVSPIDISGSAEMEKYILKND